MTDRTAHRPLAHFSMDHWRAWTRPMVLDSGASWVTEPFQDAIVEDLFSGVPEMLCCLPEGNGKTTLLAGLVLYCCAHEPESAVVMAASSREQCGLLLGQQRGFIRRTPGLAQRFRVFEGYRRIDCLRTGGRIQVFSADEGNADGALFSLAVLDEIHRHRSLGLYRTWRGKLSKRGGQLVAISTAGEPGGEFEALRARARTEAPESTVVDRHVRAASPEMILHDWALRPDDDPEDLDLVKRANPLSTVTVETLKAKRSSPSTTPAHWSRFVCNLATRGTESAAVGEREWLDAGVDERIERRPCDVGLDLGWKYDATALVPLFAIDAGHLLGAPSIVTPPRDGNSLRVEQIHSAFEALNECNPIQRVVMDPSAGGELIASWLEDELDVQVVSHSQKPDPMALAAERFLEGLRKGTLWHVRDPDLTRHVLNAADKPLPDGRFRFVRAVESRSAADLHPQREIDALIAAAIVYSVAVAETGTYDGPLLEVLS